MKLQEVVTLACRDSYCPTIFRADSGDYVVQGYRVDRAALDPAPAVPEGEDVVLVPADLVDAFLATVVSGVPDTSSSEVLG